MKVQPPFLVPDGLSEIKDELPLIMKMIARTARWVHPDTFKALPIWCPDTARGHLRYDSTWSHVLVNGRGVQKREANVRAAAALVEALGVGRPRPRNWTVCHIWGYDDETFAGPGNGKKPALLLLHRKHDLVADAVEGLYRCGS